MQELKHCLISNKGVPVWSAPNEYLAIRESLFDLPQMSI
jgi:hypothetical protein